MQEDMLFYKAIQENLAPMGPMYQRIRALPKQPVPRRAGRFALGLAASLLVTAGVLLAIPGARAAILQWLKPAVESGKYLEITPEERRDEGVPALDAAISSAKEQALTVSVVDAQDEEWQAWAEGLRVELDELLYDGEALYITGTLCGNARDLVKPLSEYTESQHGSGVTWSPPADLVSCSAAYQLQGGEYTYTYRSALTRGSDYSLTDCSPEYESDSIPIHIELPLGEGLAGVQSLTLELIFVDIGTLWQEEADPQAGTHPKAVALRIEGLSFDASAGTEAISSIPLPREAAALKGEVRVFSYTESEDGKTAQVGNELLSLEGATLSALSIKQRMGGTEITLCLHLPDSWNSRQRNLFSDRFSVSFLIDGEAQGGFGSAYMGITYYDGEQIGALGLEGPPDVEDFKNIVFTLRTGLTAEDWARIKSLGIYLCADELTGYNGALLSTERLQTVDIDPNGWEEDLEKKEFTDSILWIKGGK